MLIRCSYRLLACEGGGERERREREERERGGEERESEKDKEEGKRRKGRKGEIGEEVGRWEGGTGGERLRDGEIDR